jgi:hypothetical protein
MLQGSRLARAAFGVAVFCDVPTQESAMGYTLQIKVWAFPFVVEKSELSRPGNRMAALGLPWTDERRGQKQ